VIAVKDVSTVYIISFDRMGSAYIIDYISVEESEGTICWVELMGHKPSELEP
jgi:hypothetical protein